MGGRSARKSGQPDSLREIFTRIYKENFWADDESVSGTGSNLEQTRVVVMALPRLLRELGADSLLDIPCGDSWWMKEVDLPVGRYLGADVVADLVARNREMYGEAGREFQCLDITQDDLPRVDVVLCRDCLVHFSYEDIFRALRNIVRSGSKYLVATTFIARDSNRDILSGQWRPLNLELPPCCFPAPVRILPERCTEEGFSDKSLGVWKITALGKLIFPAVVPGEVRYSGWPDRYDGPVGLGYPRPGDG